MTSDMEVAWNRATKRTNLQEELAEDSELLSTISTQMSSELQSIAEGPQLSVEGLGTLDSTDRRFLGKDVLTRVWEDNHHMVLPSWIGRVPPRVGSSQHGKLSADQLRSTCTINLVTTLISVWGIAPEGSKWKIVLDNFMDLVVAVKLAHMRTLTPKRIQKYHFYMYRYLCTMQELYPHISIQPVQHMSLHLTRLMEQFGPVHAWRCFAFERYNGILQNIPTNYQFGRLSEVAIV